MQNIAKPVSRVSAEHHPVYPIILLWPPGRETTPADVCVVGAQLPAKNKLSGKDEPRFSNSSERICRANTGLSLILGDKFVKAAHFSIRSLVPIKQSQLSFVKNLEKVVRRNLL